MFFLDSEVVQLFKGADAFVLPSCCKGGQGEDGSTSVIYTTNSFPLETGLIHISNSL